MSLIVIMNSDDDSDFYDCDEDEEERVDDEEKSDKANKSDEVVVIEDADEKVDEAELAAGLKAVPGKSSESEKSSDVIDKGRLYFGYINAYLKKKPYILVPATKKEMERDMKKVDKLATFSAERWATSHMRLEPNEESSSKKKAPRESVLKVLRDSSAYHEGLVCLQDCCFVQTDLFKKIELVTNTGGSAAFKSFLFSKRGRRESETSELLQIQHICRKYAVSVGLLVFVSFHCFPHFPLR